MVTYETLKNLLDLKLSVIPSGGGPTKKAPLVEWTEYQKRLPTEAELVLWSNNGLRPTLWGIVTGEISKVVVFDADDQTAMDIFHKAGLNPHVKTRRGEHYYFKWPGHLYNNKAGVLPHIDLRGDGGFVNCLGENENARYEMLVVPKFENLYELTQLPYDVKMALLKPASQSQQDFKNIGETIPQGQQDNWLFFRAKTYVDQGDSEDIIIAKLKIDVLRCPQDPGNPFTDKDFIRIAKSSLKYKNTNESLLYADEHIIYKEKKGDYKGGNTPLPCDAEAKTSQNKKVSLDGVTKNVTTSQENNKASQPSQTVTDRHTASQNIKITRDSIRNYLMESSGKWVFIRDVDNDLGIKTPEDKHLRRQSVYQMIKDGLVERDPLLDNKIRFMNSAANKLNLSLSSLGKPLDIRFPFMIQNKVDIYPKNIILVAGAMNSGKTALLLNIARMNKDRFPVVYFSSEMAEQELVNRITRFNDGKENLDEWQNVDFRERSHDFADVIRPDDLNIIDYIELNENIYLIGGMLEAIYNRLRNGVAVATIQKKVGALFGRGQEFSAEKPRLYLSIDAGKLTIVKGKNWHNKNDNPNRQCIRFKLVNGCDFIQIGNWGRLED